MDKPVSTIFQRCEQADADTKSGPYGWIQWKGTNVCMDIHCRCGEHTHIDGDFAYTIRCGKCGQLYGTCANVRLLPITEEEFAAEDRCEPVTSY